MPHFRPGRPDNVIVLQHHRIAGLTVAETLEFESLDAQAPLDEQGQIAWMFEGPPMSNREKRWLELFNKISKPAW